MEKILQSVKKERIFMNIIGGAGVGLFIWILHIMFYRIFGLQPAYFSNVGEFVLGGMIIGSIIGMISSEITWHKEKDQNHKRL